MSSAPSPICARTPADAARHRRVPVPRLAKLVRPSGYFRQKAKKLKAFVRFLRSEYGGSLARMFRDPHAGTARTTSRRHGIGPETADSILLYAGGHPVFVVDAYTHRILGRHGSPRKAGLRGRCAPSSKPISRASRAVQRIPRADCQRGQKLVPHKRAALRRMPA